MQLYLEFQHVYAIFFGAVSGALICSLLLQFHQRSFWAAVTEGAFAFSLLPVQRGCRREDSNTSHYHQSTTTKKRTVLSISHYFKLETPTSCKMLLKALWFFAELA